MKNYQDFCTQASKTLLDIIDEHGSLLKYKQQWNNAGSKLLPESQNGIYKGGNLMMLFLSQIEKGYSSNKWLTFKQVSNNKGKVKKGSKSQQVYFWSLIERKNKSTSELEKQPVFRVYNVFNLEQTDLDDAQLNELSLDGDVHKLIDVSGASVSNFGGGAYFNASDDVIVMPTLDRFINDESYQATLLHELVHWTGHKSRLNRDSIRDYGSDITIRAYEELIAEIGAFLLCSHFGISSDVFNHASYVQSWKQNLNDKQVMKAITDATKAFHFLIEKMQSKELSQAA